MTSDPSGDCEIEICEPRFDCGIDRLSCFGTGKCSSIVLCQRKGVACSMAIVGVFHQ